MDGRDGRDGTGSSHHGPFKRLATNLLATVDSENTSTRPDRINVPGTTYSSRPFHPYIHVPMTVDGPNGPCNTCTIVPTFENVDPSHLNAEDLAIITQGRPQMAKDVSADWRYGMRRLPQKIVDFLYLGPSMAAKDKEFLQREGITMVFLIRDEMMINTRLLSIERVAAELGLATASVDVRNGSEVASFSQAVRIINDHLLGVYRQQLVPSPAGTTPSSAMIDSSSFRRGKVLIYCETGNMRSPMVVAAYMMATYGLKLVTAIQFIMLQRFCVNFDDDTKHILLTWDDLIEARRDVGRASAEESADRLQLQQTIQEAWERNMRAQNTADLLANPDEPTVMTSFTLPTMARSKRGIDDMMDDGDDIVNLDSNMEVDLQ